MARVCSWRRDEGSSCDGKAGSSVVDGLYEDGQWREDVGGTKLARGRGIDVESMELLRSARQARTNSARGSAGVGLRWCGAAPAHI